MNAEKAKERKNKKQTNKQTNKKKKRLTVWFPEIGLKPETAELAIQTQSDHPTRSQTGSRRWSIMYAEKKNFPIRNEN